MSIRLLVHRHWQRSTGLNANDCINGVGGRVGQPRCFSWFTFPSITLYDTEDHLRPKLAIQSSGVFNGTNLLVIPKRVCTRDCSKSHAVRNCATTSIRSLLLKLDFPIDFIHPSQRLLLDSQLRRRRVLGTNQTNICHQRMQKHGAVIRLFEKLLFTFIFLQ